MSRHRFLAALFLLVAGCAGAMACGPEFPWQLLDDRPRTLKELPDNSFAFEAAHLVPVPADAPKPSNWQPKPASETAADSDADPASSERRMLESEKLTPEQQQAIRGMRLAGTDTDAEASGHDLPADMRLYTLGARAFAAKAYPLAITRFKAAMDASPSQPTIYTVWAAFMLGRAQAARGDEDAALQSYAALRKTVAGGAPDPLDVAIASYGEEGRFMIAHADDAKRGKAPGWQAKRAEALQQATRLYAIQAALQSQEGVTSLLVVADELAFDTADLEAAIGDETTRKLVIAYALSRASDSSSLDFSDPYRLIGTFDRTLLDAPAGEFDPVTNLLSAIEAKHLDSVDGADRLAALAYRSGRYDLAEGFAAKSDAPLGLWVRAKLAVRAGKADDATKFYAKAVEALAAAPAALDTDFGRRLRGEQGVMTLSRQDYLVAMAQLYPDANVYWGDVAYLAERILTVDELKGFVDAHAPAVPAKSDRKMEYIETPAITVTFPDPGLLLRGLLARRLMREGRPQDALPYFADKDKPVAEAYAKMVAASETNGRIARARALHELAQDERTNGMTLLGTEAYPDLEVYDGGIGSGLGQTDVRGNLAQSPSPPSLPEAFTSADEAQRFAKSAPTPNLRYHYRYTAADHEAQAATLVPPRSQAYAALLCQAASYMYPADPAAERKYYRLYLQHGAFVPWAKSFGQACPAPDFDEAAAFHWRQIGKYLRHISLARMLVGGAAATIGLSVLGGAVLLARRRQR